MRTDNRAGILAVLKQLHEQGHRRFAFVGPPSISDCRERCDAVLEFAASQRDCAPPPVQDAADFSYIAAPRLSAG